MTTYKVLDDVEQQIARMTLDEAYYWAAKRTFIFHTSEEPLIVAAEALIVRHEEKVRSAVKKTSDVLEQTQAVDEEAAWNKLPFYMKWIYMAIDWFRTPLFWKVERWHIAAFLVILAVFFFGGRGVSGILKRFAIANADPSPTEVVNPAALLSVAPQADLNQPNPNLLLQQSLPNQQVAIVDCTTQTCPDATQHIANYPFPDDPDGSATLRSLDGKIILGQIPKGTSVWIITASIEKGKFCKTMPGTTTEECRRGQIKPIAALPFTYNGGWVSFTALQPVSP